MQKHVALLLVLVAAGIYILGTIGANNDLIPDILKELPWFDEVGHFVIFGFIAFALAVFAKLKTPQWRWAYVVVGVFQVVDECLQLLHAERTFTVTDIFWSQLGILTFFLFHRFLLKKGVL